MDKNINQLKQIEQSINWLGFEKCLDHSSEVKKSREFKDLKSGIKQVGGWGASFHKLEHNITHANRSVSAAELDQGYVNGMNFITAMAKSLAPNPKYEGFLDDLKDKGFLSVGNAKGLLEILTNIKRVNKPDDNGEIKGAIFNLAIPENVNENMKHCLTALQGDITDHREDRYLHGESKDDVFESLHPIFKIHTPESADLAEKALKGLVKKLEDLKEKLGVGDNTAGMHVPQFKKSGRAID